MKLLNHYLPNIFVYVIGRLYVELGENRGLKYVLG